ncbi:MAG: sortase [Chloroflexota bacterium]|nr:MAG: sortase [Chloroflexota bacterium]
MKRTLLENLNITLGFLLAILAITGMCIAIFMPAVLTANVSPGYGIGALAVPLHHFNEQPETTIAVEDEFKTPEPLYVTVDIGDTNLAPSPSEVIPQNSLLDEAVSLVPDTGSPGKEEPTEVQLPPEVPARIVISSIDLDAPVVPAPVEFETLAGKEFMKWLVPDERATGWHITSAMLGEPGNTVLNGHHNAFGEVFVNLDDVVEGDIIWVESENSRFRYQITNKIVLPEKYEELEVRMHNAQWLLPSVDERLTLISCWPYESNTHRLIVVASPLGREEIESNQ